MQFPDDILKVEDATVSVNSMPFPRAIDGDSVKQFGYWFDLINGSWIARPNQACMQEAYVAEQLRIQAELEAIPRV